MGLVGFRVLNLPKKWNLRLPVKLSSFQLSSFFLASIFKIHNRSDGEESYVVGDVVCFVGYFDFFVIRPHMFDESASARVYNHL